MFCIVDGGRRRRLALQPAEASRVVSECLRLRSGVIESVARWGRGS